MIVMLPSRYDARADRLALGIQPMDAARGQRIAHPVQVYVEGAPFVAPLSAEQVRWLAGLVVAGTPIHDTWQRVARHASCRHALRYAPGRGAAIDVRILDARARFVPRRLRVPLPPLGVPEDVDVLDALPATSRAVMPALFPAAAYDVPDGVTALRGRVVTSDGLMPATLTPVRWARVEARTAAGGPAIAWAHGDRHGEFLLLLPPNAIPAPAVELPAAPALLVTAFGPSAPPATPPLEVRAADPYWDVPLETLAAPGSGPDAVADGQAIPASYDASQTRTIALTLGTTTSATFVIA